MKIFHKLFAITACLVLILSSCSIQKRNYRSGYHIEWKKSAHNNGRHELSENKVRHDVNPAIATEVETKEPQGTSEPTGTTPAKISSATQKAGLTDRAFANKKISENKPAKKEFENKRPSSQIKQRKSDSGSHGGRGLGLILLALLLLLLGLVFLKFVLVLGLILFLIFAIGAGIFLIIGLILLLFA